MEQQKEYRSIVKTTALFGGVQAFQVLLTLVRTKVVALLLGVDGVGLLGLLNRIVRHTNSFVSPKKLFVPPSGDCLRQIYYLIRNERRIGHLPRLPASPDSGTSQFNRCIRRPVNLPTYILHMENRWPIRLSLAYQIVMCRLTTYKLL